MAFESRRILPAFPVATGVGSQTITTLLDAFDLSKAKSLTLVLKITGASLDHLDTLDTYFQTTFDDPTLSTAIWDTRIRPLTVFGDDGTTAPGYGQAYAVSQDVDLQSSERGYTLTGSGAGTPGQAELNPGTVRDGPFPPRFRNANGPQSNWRIQMVVVDADADANFTGTVEVLAHEF